MSPESGVGDVEEELKRRVRQRTGLIEALESMNPVSYTHLDVYKRQKPAFFAEEDDVIENIDNDMLALNSDFVMEVLKHI